ncbi:MAG: alpha/beta fold hydrolase [Dermatophilus congolensis]|nr:alpha/beta fold hydrolase [Dermatophilus congolensis]
MTHKDSRGEGARPSHAAPSASRPSKRGGTARSDEGDAGRTLTVSGPMDRSAGTTDAARRAPRRRRRTIALALVLLLFGWLAFDKVASIVSPEPAVGHWRSLEGAQAYARAYDEVMRDLPQPDATLDVPISYGSVRVLRWDGTDSGPPALLLPGHSSGAPMWSENLPSWIGKRTLFALDPIGDAGFSTQSVPLTSYDDQAEWISETVTGLGSRALAGGRVHAVGHSFGGANAAIFALRYPEQVASLTLLEPAFAIEPMSASTFFWATLTQLPVPQGWKDRALAEIGGTTVAEVQERTPMSVMIDTAAQQYSTSLPMPRTLSDDEWRSMRMPLRVDIGGTKSLAGGQEAVDRIRALLPEAEAKLWPSATHSLPMQEKDTLGPELLTFWRDNS